MKLKALYEDQSRRKFLQFMGKGAASIAGSPLLNFNKIITKLVGGKKISDYLNAFNKSPFGKRKLFDGLSIYDLLDGITMGGYSMKGSNIVLNYFDSALENRPEFYDAIKKYITSKNGDRLTIEIPEDVYRGMIVKQASDNTDWLLAPLFWENNDKDILFDFRVKLIRSLLKDNENLRRIIKAAIQTGPYWFKNVISYVPELGNYTGITANYISSKYKYPGSDWSIQDVNMLNKHGLVDDDYLRRTIENHKSMEKYRTGNEKITSKKEDESQEQEKQYKVPDEYDDWIQQRFTRVEDIDK